ncbi:MAG: hypothetical protein HY049_12550 [Acidobacteria bacterium]|nr:hypothetical protein [Acidobacteriota bacterium]
MTPVSGAATSGRLGKKIGYAATAVVVAGLGVAGFLALRGWRGGAAAKIPASADRGEAAAAAGGRSEDRRQRIVVLPFENLGAPDDGYFAAGMTEEITSRLASVSGLGVISRTSAVQYAKTDKNTKQIGSELDVDFVLAGTVRWERGGAGPSRVRVTPQLVRVADDTQLWGDRYDREMKDIFEVQSEIADQVVQKLGVAMRAPERQAMVSQSTQNLDAYQIYLRGKEKVDSPNFNREIGEQAVQLLAQAVQLDPKFALAWATLSKLHSTVYQNHFDFTEERLGKARECADRALALQPMLREGHLALGYYFYWGRRDYVQAVEEFRLAAAGREDDPEALEAMSYMWRRQGHWGESIGAAEKAFALNPRNIDLASNLSGTYQMLRRYPEALRFADIAISLAPEAPFAYVTKLFVQVEAEGSTRGARETLGKIDPRAFPELPGLESYLDALDGRLKESLDRLDAFPKDALDTSDAYLPISLLKGSTYLLLNDRARAQVACESARKSLVDDIARTPRDARMRSALGLALACLGRKDEAVREAKLAMDIAPISSDAVDGPRYLESLAQVYVMVGDNDAALDLLGRLLSMPGGSAANRLKLDRVWAPLWSLPRFQKMTGKGT